MKNSSHSEAVIALGKKILAEFKDHGDSDILTGWMSHHLAALIASAEEARPEVERIAAQQACVNGILKLWSHRNMLPEGVRPFRDAELAVETLVRLSPDASQNFFFRGISPPKSDSDRNAADAKGWLEFAEAFDRNGREFIRFCLSQSLSTASPELREWLNISQGLQEPLELDIKLVHKLLEDTPHKALEEVVSDKKSNGTETLDRLDRIIDSLGHIRQTMAQQLKSG